MSEVSGGAPAEEPPVPRTVPIDGEELSALLTAQMHTHNALDSLRDTVDAHAEAIELLPQVAEELQGLAERVSTLEDADDDDETPEEPPKPAMWDWTHMGEEARSKAWTTLTRWVDVVVSGVYHKVAAPLAASGGVRVDPTTNQVLDENTRVDVIPSCWYEHPDVVADLSVMCQYWLHIYSDPGVGAYRNAADWITRYWPDVLKRITTTSTASACFVTGHARLAPRQRGEAPTEPPQIIRDLFDDSEDKGSDTDGS